MCCHVNSIPGKLTIFTIKHHRGLIKVWGYGEPARSSSWKYNWNFPLPVGGVMTLQAWTLVKRVEFGTDLTMYTWVTTASCFMAAHRNSPHHHGNAIGWKLTIFTIKHHRGLIKVWGYGEPARSSSWKYNWFRRRSASKCKTCHFLLPVDGAMTTSEYWNVDVFRPGLLSNMNFGVDWTTSRSTLKLKIKIKMADFLLHLGHGTNRLFL